MSGGRSNQRREEKSSVIVQHISRKLSSSGSALWPLHMLQISFEQRPISHTEGKKLLDDISVVGTLWGVGCQQLQFIFVLTLEWMGQQQEADL